MKALIYQEFTVQNKIYNLVKYTLIFFIFCCLSVTLVNSYENIQVFGIVFSVVCIPLAFISISTYLIKPDIEDGSIELLLISFSSNIVILAKYLALCTCCTFSFILTAPIIYVVYNIQPYIFVLVLACSLLLLFLSAALIILIASIQGYFRSNTNFLAILILPLIIPNIVLSGVFIQNPNDLYLLLIMVGINLVVIPPSLYLSGYLVENIYNI
jgi:heme exporter protein B